METPERTQQVESRWTEPEVTERCRILTDTLRARGEPDTALAACAPGGERNAATDPLGAAITWYSLLRGRLAFLDWQEEAERERAHAALAAALTNAPIPVECSDGITRAVHPKSYHALAWCDALDRALEDVRGKAQRLEDLEMRAMEPLLQSLAVRVWAWILTHEGPELPFREGDPNDPPEWTEHLTPNDILALLKAHFTVNRERIALVARLFPSEKESESKLSLSGFLATTAQELHQRPSEVLTRWSLGEVFAQAVTAAQAAREGRQRAERESNDRRTR